MLKKTIATSVFALIIAMMMVTESGARIIGGTYWTGSVSCENIRVTGLGNVSLDPKFLACTANAVDEQVGTPVVVFCANNGGNVAPGVQAFLAAPIGGITTIFPDQVDKNGTAKNLKVHAEATPEQLQALNTVCQDALNINWFAVDVVPIDALIKVLVLDDQNGTLQEKDALCHLPNGESLGWDKKAQAPERRQYDCTEL